VSEEIFISAGSQSSTSNRGKLNIEIIGMASTLFF